MERNMKEKIKQDQVNRLTLKKEEVKFLTKDEVEKMKIKYSEFDTKNDEDSKSD